LNCQGDRKGAALIGVHLNAAVILSAAKDLRSAPREILRCAQDDRWYTFAVALEAASSNTTRAIPNSGVALVKPTVDGHEGEMSRFAYQLRNDLIRLSTLFT
jgi:hypothetical protein